ncbi:MAG: DEAD/DEAH box helicase, partial [Planctomycetes bacterium]|nr:DEAD/DEAH box helicase [Planctomycetota bacterium]
MHKHLDLPAAFVELGIAPPFLIALKKMGFVEPSDVQRQVIPIALEGKDVLAQARTGTGKTAAFGLPILQMIRLEAPLQALILVPTRELAVQVAAELRRLAGDVPLHVVPVYGGQKISHQAHLLGRKPHVVVGTPGRVMDLLGRRLLNFGHIRFVVLDEVDRMLDIGFRDDIRKILSQVTSAHQTIFASATITDEIKNLAMRYTEAPIEVNVSRDLLTVEEVAQTYVTVDPWDKFDALTRLLKAENPHLAIVFCNTKHATRRLAKRLHGIGLNVKEIHGDLVQEKRERVMDRFRKHKVQVLVATDLAARGIDVHGISHIINYDVPDDPHVYVHRIGRTARMGSFGKAIMLVTRE